jgi:hypothetical protein
MLAAFVGFWLGGAAVRTIHAQANPPVYMIAINEVSNQEGYAKEYLPPAQKSIKEHGGSTSLRDRERGSLAVCRMGES